MLRLKKDKKIKLLVLFLAFFTVLSVSSSFVAASRHLYHVGDEHDHPLNCPLREFLDIIAISFAFAAVILTSLIIKRIQFKEIYHSFISTAFNLPLSRAPPAF